MLLYLVSIAGDTSLPRDLINVPLTVVYCIRVEGIPDLWDVELKRPDGSDMEYLVTSEDLSKGKPF